MPKNKKKDKKARYLGRGADSGTAMDADGAELDGDDSDTMSVMSVNSSMSVNAPVNEDAVDDDGSRQLMADKLATLVDSATEKSAVQRVAALRALSSHMSHQWLDLGDDWNRLETLKDALERALKRGAGREQEVAALLFGQLCLQLDSDAVCERLGSFRALLRNLMLDDGAALLGRTAAASALGCGTFLSSDTSSTKLQEVMSDLESIFRASFLKGDKSVPCHVPDKARLHTAALEAWALLLTIASPVAVERYRTGGVFGRLPELLLSGDVGLRIAAGETIALMYELIRMEESRAHYKGPGFAQLTGTLNELSTDGDKSRSKTDRRKQRGSFRDIVAFIELGEQPYDAVKFGAQEKLHLDSWLMKRRYDGLCTLLGQGINAHLSDNVLVRDIFELGEPLLKSEGAAGRHGAFGSKSERQAALAAANKDLTQRRDRQRNKRQAMCQQFDE